MYEGRDCSADFHHFRRLGPRLDSWALASEASAAKDIFAAIASNGERDFGDLLDSVESGSLDGWDADWVARLARVIALQPHEAALHTFAKRALSLAVAALPRIPPTLNVRKLLFELLFQDGRLDDARALIDGDKELSSLYFRYLTTDLLNPFATGSSDRTDAWLEGFNAPFVEAGLSPVSVNNDADTPFDGLRATATAGSEEGPLVSVIVTTFNPNPVEIRTAVGSILQQTWSNLEVLLVDDHSEEGSVGTLESLAAEDSRIRLIRLPENGGTYRARNAGIRAATGKYLTGQDTDDWSHPERIAQQVAVLEQEHDLPGVTTAANRTGNDLVKLAPGNNPHRRCEVSLMLRVESARALGGYLPVRKAADSEFRERLEQWWGAPVKMLDAPMYMIRMSPGSLSRADFRPGWSHHARRSFWSSYKQWHTQASRDELQIDAESEAVRVPATAPWRIAGREWAVERAFDVCMVADWRGTMPQQRAALDELRALATSDLTVAILHLDTPWGGGRDHRSLHPEVQQLITDGAIGQVFFDEEIHLDLLIVRDPATMDFCRIEPSALQISRLLMVEHADHGHQVAAVREYDPLNAHAVARGIFGMEASWVVLESQAAESFGQAFGLSVERDRYPIYIDEMRYSGVRLMRAESQQLIVGCTANNDELAWPIAEEIPHAYPMDGTVEVRVLGDARGALRAPGEKRLPATWIQFRLGEIAPEIFWRTVDVVVVYDQVTGPPFVDRVVLEAIASGALVVTDEHRAAAYGAAVLGTPPSNAIQCVTDVLADPNERDSLRRHGKKLVQHRSDPSTITGFIEKHVHEARAGADTHV